MIFRENSVKNGVEKDGDLFYFFIILPAETILITLMNDQKFF